MVKRRLDEQEAHSPPAKRARGDATRDHLATLSDELLLRIFSYLSVSNLCLCQRVSKRFSAIAGDSQIWKQHYYNRFVRPRAARLPSVKDARATSSSLYFSSKLSKWLDEDNLVKRGKDTNWKRQYKLRDNWSRGSCDISEIPVAEQPPVPQLLVRLQDGVLFTVDAVGGLRAWSAKKERRLLASITFGPPENVSPTSLAVDVVDSKANHQLNVAVGFSDGHFSVYGLNRSRDSLEHLYSHPSSSNGMVSAVAYASPYLLTMTSDYLLSLYLFSNEAIRDPPRLLYSLKSQTVRSPLSLSVRSSESSITASIAYMVPTYFSGWSVGVQETKLSLSGELIDSRLATSSHDAYISISSSVPSSTSPTRPGTPASNGDDFLSETLLSRTRPTSLSYSHPYLLLSHPDNTLTLYLVTSTSSSLTIGKGSRLWGHTSSVSGAHVGGRGKAVSVSSHGDELRIWELEGGLSSLSMRKRLSTGQLSVRVQSERRPQSEHQDLDVLSEAIADRGSGLGLAVNERVQELSITRGWVGFDEENVVVLREKGNGGQALVVYDFT